MTIPIITLANCPFKRVSNLVVINTIEFIMAPPNGDSVWWKQECDGLYKYNIISNEWSLYIKYPNNFTVFEHTISFNLSYKESTKNIRSTINNTNNNKIRKKYTQTDKDLVNGYIHRYLHKIISMDIIELLILFYGATDEIYMFHSNKIDVINLTTQQFKQYKLRINNRNYRKKVLLSASPSVIYGDGSFHIISGRNCASTHFKYHPNTKILNKITHFNERDSSVSSQGLIYIKNGNNMLLFGGWDTKINCVSTSIYKYSLNMINDSWHLVFDCKLPEKMRSFSYLLTNNERYLIIFGDLFRKKNKDVNIYILDILNMRWKLKYISQLQVDSVVIMMKNNDIHVIHSNDSHFKINVIDLIPSYQSN